MGKEDYDGQRKREKEIIKRSILTRKMHTIHDLFVNVTHELTSVVGNLL